MISQTEEKKAFTNPIPLSVAAQLAMSLYDKITGYAYSDADVRRLGELKHIYQELLSNNPPLVWELDASQKPTHRMSHHKWSDHIRQLSRGKHKVGHFHYQGSLIAEYSASYLAERGKRWFGGGTEGDLLEQFIGEWVNFSLNELPHLDYDEDAIEKIQSRIRYLEKIQKHETLFKFGTITRARNKFDTIESIKQQLYSCADLALKESLRQCAREKLDLCRSSTSGILVACVKALYYGRATPVYQEPLEIQSFVGQQTFYQSLSAKLLYPQVKKTHSGAILNELLELSGLEAFGIAGESGLGPLQREYILENSSSSQIDWSAKNFDLPPWIDVTQSVAYLRSCQKLAESALRVAKLKQLVETAYDLTGKIGDLWAYGDAEGKLSLNGLLFLLEKELDAFYLRFDKYYQYQNRLRHIYNLTQRVNPDNEINKNFNKVDEQNEDLAKYYKLVKKAVKNIRERMSEFTEEEVKRIDNKKKSFYRSISTYMSQYYPEYADQYQSLDFAAQVEGSLSDGLEADDGPSPQERLDLENYCYAYNAKSKASLVFLADLAYKQWKKDFIQRYKEDHQELLRLKAAFRMAVDSQATMDELKAAVSGLANQLAVLKNFAEYERPGWSYYSLGWPFNGQMRANINYIVGDLDDLLREVKACIGKEDFASVEKPSSTVKIHSVIEMMELKPEKTEEFVRIKIANSPEFEKISVDEEKEPGASLKSSPG